MWCFLSLMCQLLFNIMSPYLSVCLGVNFNHESSLPQSAAFLLLCRHDLPRLHLLWVDCTGTIPRKGNYHWFEASRWGLEGCWCESLHGQLLSRVWGNERNYQGFFFPFTDFAPIYSCKIAEASKIRFHKEAPKYVCVDILCSNGLKHHSVIENKL